MVQGLVFDASGRAVLMFVITVVSGTHAVITPSFLPRSVFVLPRLTPPSVAPFEHSDENLAQAASSRQQRERRSRRRSLFNRRRNFFISDPTTNAKQRKTLVPRCVAEAMGTFTIMCAAQTASAIGISAPATAVLMGIAVGTAIAACASISGAHFNPAVTLTLMASSTFPLGEGFLYMASQCTGALTASMMVSNLFSPAALACVPTFAAEAKITGILLYACLAIGDGVQSGAISKRVSPCLIGLVITTLSLAFEPLSVGLNPAMNAATRFNVAVTSRGVDALAGAFAFAVGPCVGALAGGGFFAMVSGRGEGIYKGLARCGRVMSPWYGEHWTPVPVPRDSCQVPSWQEACVPLERAAEAPSDHASDRVLVVPDKVAIL